MDKDTEMLVQEVSAILLKDWDPLEVADMPDARREYDPYAAEIVSRHQAGELSAENLYEYLKITAERELSRVSEEEPAKRTVNNVMTILKQ
jgi:hypothetical protein